MRNRYLIAAAVALATLLLTAIVFAHGRGYGSHMGYWWGSVPEELELTQAQLTEIEKVRNWHLRESSAVRAEIGDLNAAILNELGKDKPSADKLNALREQRIKAYEKLDELRVQMKKKIDSILTEKQREYFSRYGYGSCCTGMGGYGPQYEQGYGGHMMGPWHGGW